jgi:hypothetical protein
MPGTSGSGLDGWGIEGVCKCTLYERLLLGLVGLFVSPALSELAMRDGIHQSVTEFLHSMQRLTLDNQVKLIDQVKEKHLELGKYL